MARAANRLPTNVAGDLYVDSSCIDCDTCRWVAPETFDRAEGQSRVRAQPAGDEQHHRALMALVACPTSSIGSESSVDVRAAANAFPETIDGPVHYCGYHAEASFGAASWLILREGGNVLVDSPRFAGPLVRRLEELGGVHTLFLTHSDDVADHERFAAHFGARRILHAADAGGIGGIEMVIDGNDDVVLDEDLRIIPTPGHTAGSACLLHRDRHLFTGDHLAWSPRRQALGATKTHCWYSWPEQIRSMERLAERRFEWVLPGHGRMCHFPAEVMGQRMAECLDWMRSVA